MKIHIAKLNPNIQMATVKVLICSLILTIPQLCLGALTQRRAGTWNLQGSSASTESKWSNNVRLLLTGANAVAVLAIQEAGTPPATAQLQPSLGNRLLDPMDVRQPVREYRWNVGSSSRPDYRWIYYIQNDLTANRVNVALVTVQRADRVIILKPTADFRTVRPILGVQFGKDNYFTIHASASGGGDAASIVNLIHNYFGSTQQYDHQFMILGDFNRTPRDLSAALQRQYPGLLNFVGIFAPNTPTHNSGKVLDYCVIGQYHYDLQHHLTVGSATSSIQGQLVSDHKPVVFSVRAP